MGGGDGGGGGGGVCVCVCVWGWLGVFAGWDDWDGSAGIKLMASLVLL